MTNMPDNKLLHIIPASIALNYKVVPIEKVHNTLTLLIEKGYRSHSILKELELLTDSKVVLEEVSTEEINKLLSTHYKYNKDINPTLTNNSDFLISIINEAKALKSSDIHIESYAGKCRVRFRIDGKLIERHVIKKEEYTAFINKIKIKSRLDIAEKRLPQDGRIQINEGLDKTDIRVSVLPSLYGEKVVLRLLNNDSSHIDINSLGFDKKQLEDYLRILKKSHGIVLISGPTGSGKTTTLYATLKLLNKESNNILTIEDPIEYTIEGVNQVQLKESIGLTFSSALRTFLRQDPDIIMLGEIRDAETAQMAIRAALTGHLVLSTIHTNSAWGTVSRLIDMGVPPFLLASTLNMTIAQRLVRKLCSHCKKMVINDTTILKDIKELYEAVGCDKCYHTGYMGRIAIYEVIPIDYHASDMIKKNETNIDYYANERLINLLKDSAINVIKSGMTSVDEIYPILINY